DMKKLPLVTTFVLAAASLPAAALASLPAVRDPRPLSVATTPAQLCLGERDEVDDRGKNGQRGGDKFDPYGKDDPNGPKWGRAAGPENRYGGLGNRTDAAEKKEKAQREKTARQKADRDRGRDNDNDDRERDPDRDED